MKCPVLGSSVAPDGRLPGEGELSSEYPQDYLDNIKGSLRSILLPLHKEQRGAAGQGDRRSAEEG